MTHYTDDSGLKTLFLLQNPLIMFAQKFLLNSGYVLPKEGEKAREWCRERAIGGDPDAQVAYAQLLHFGFFGYKSSDEALDLIELAANKGHPSAMIALSPNVEKGLRGEAADVDKARELIERAADNGYAPALELLATWCEFGINVQKNHELALGYRKKAVALGYAASQFALGSELMKSSNPALKGEGLALIETPAQQDFFPAHEMLATAFFRGTRGLAVDQEKSRYHQQRAHEIESEAGVLFDVK